MSPFQRPCMFRAGRVDVNVKGCSSWRQVRRGCMFSAGRSVFWCLLVGAESDFCGRDGRWKGLIFRHNKVHVQNQGTVLKKSSLREVHPGDFPSRQGENERRPISCAHSSWIKRSTLLCRKMTRVHPVVSFPLVVSRIQRIGCQPPKKQLYTVANPACGLLNREKKKKKSLAAPPAPLPPPCAARSEKKIKQSRDASTFIGATQVGVMQVVSVRLASVQGFPPLVSY